MKRNRNISQSARKLVRKRGKIAFSILRYVVLAGFGFVFMYPVLYMLVNSFKSVEDLVDPAVEWIPTSIDFVNYVKAFYTLDFVSSFGNSLLTSVLPAILQTFSCAIAGYGLARYPVPGKKFWIAMIIMTFVVPTQITLIPKYLMFSNYNMVNTIWPVILPAMLAQGLKGSLFVLIFWNFFSSYPQSLDEAAYLDGAGALRVFFKVALPLSRPAIVVSMIFSIVWYWNETTQSSLLYGSVIKTLPMKLSSFADSYSSLYASAEGTTNSINEAISLAGTMMSILPLMILYLVLQKQFVESIEKVGIAGE